MRNVNITGGNVTINIFDGCSIESIRIGGKSLKEACSPELLVALKNIVQALEADTSERCEEDLEEGVRKKLAN
ncbi:MAG: hypothetical protein JW883_05240 [Deltaproteobacteria bacterium]|nr:hypothetical protein [Deltaproteobacteria bacterium]